MSKINGATNGVHAVPPPSSMLASHVADGFKNRNLSRDNFTKLLQESLSDDQNGDPNLGTDVLMNARLVGVVIQVGIEPLLTSKNTDPFRRQIDQGSASDGLKDCLAVLHRVLQRTPGVVHSAIDAAQCPERASQGLYAWLLPTVLLVSVHSRDPEKILICQKIILSCLRDDPSCPWGRCHSLHLYLLHLMKGRAAGTHIRKPMLTVHRAR